MADRGVASDTHATAVMSTRRPRARLHSALAINLSFPPAFITLLHQGMIGHAPTAREHGQGLVQNLLESQGRPSTALAHLPRDSRVCQRGVSREAHRECTRNLEE
jgi:hypothetical protein